MDRTRELYPLAALFAPGEQPSGTKMTAISTQAKAGIDKLSYIVGDLWNAAGDLILSPSGNITKNALHIPNIARAIGDLARLNMAVPTTTPLSSSMQYTDVIGSRYAGMVSGRLLYAPAATPTSGNMILAGTFAPLVQGQFKSNPINIAVTGDWAVDPFGKLYTYDPIPSGMKLTYTPDVRTGLVAGTDGSREPGWNVIPDPTVWGGAYDGIKISFANNTDATTGYHIWLPPRTPISSPRSSYNSFDTSSVNTQASPDSGTLLAYQDPASNAALTNGNHYRYNFPIAITGGAANSQLPTGFLYIWDEQFGTIVDNVAYFTPSNTSHSKFKVRVVSPDLVNVFGTTVGAGILTADNTQLPADYISRFKIITVGNSLAKAVGNLLTLVANHRHDNINGATTISHADLNNLVTPAMPSDPVGLVPVVGPSAWINDDHAQYLHRGGTTGTGVSTHGRDQWDNAMFNWFEIVNVGGDTVGPGNLYFDCILGNDGGSAATAFAQIRSNNGGLQFSTIGTGQSTAWSTQRPGIFIGAQDSIGWTSVVINNGDSLSIRGGGTTGVAQIVNGQFQRMYLGLDTTFARQPTYLDWDDADEILTLQGTGVQTTFTTENLLGVLTVEAPTVIADTHFQYNPAKTQYLFISPHDLQFESTTDISLTAYGVSNIGTSLAHFMYASVKFPHGVVLDTSVTNQIYTCGNGSGGVSCLLNAYPKPSGPGFSSGPTPIPLINSSGSVSFVNTIAAPAYLSTHTVDNSLTGNIYVFQIFLPVTASSQTPAFYGASLSYKITNVNN